MIVRRLRNKPKINPKIKNACRESFEKPDLKDTLYDKFVEKIFANHPFLLLLLSTRRFLSILILRMAMKVGGNAIVGARP